MCFFGQFKEIFQNSTLRQFEFKCFATNLKQLQTILIILIEGNPLLSTCDKVLPQTFKKSIFWAQKLQNICQQVKNKLKSDVSSKRGFLSLEKLLHKRAAPKVSSDIQVMAKIGPKVPSDMQVMVKIAPKVPSDIQVKAKIAPKVPSDIQVMVKIPPKVPSDILLLGLRVFVKSCTLFENFIEQLTKQF